MTRPRPNRLMENYAGFGEYCDHEIGRLIDSLKEAGVYDNTLIIYIAGDNGMSAEGGLEGTLNELTAFNGVPDTTANILAHLDDIGGPNSFPAHSGRMGIGGRHSVPMDQAGRVALRRHAQRNGDRRGPRTSTTLAVSGANGIT